MINLVLNNCKMKFDIETYVRSIYNLYERNNEIIIIDMSDKAIIKIELIENDDFYSEYHIEFLVITENYEITDIIEKEGYIYDLCNKCLSIIQQCRCEK